MVCKVIITLPFRKRRSWPSHPKFPQRNLYRRSHWARDLVCLGRKEKSKKRKLQPRWTQEIWTSTETLGLECSFFKSLFILKQNGVKPCLTKLSSLTRTRDCFTVLSRISAVLEDCQLLTWMRCSTDKVSWVMRGFRRNKFNFSVHGIFRFYYW